MPFTPSLKESVTAADRIFPRDFGYASQLEGTGLWVRANGILGTVLFLYPVVPVCLNQ